MLKLCIAGSLVIYPIVCSLYSGGTETLTGLNDNQYLQGYKMVTDQLKYQILKDAEQQDLLPTALINKYDVSLEWLMEILKSLLNDGLLTLTEGKWLRITEKGKQSIAEEEVVPEEDNRKASYIEEFFTRSVTIGVNEPYLPSSITCMKIMEGVRQKETSN